MTNFAKKIFILTLTFFAFQTASQIYAKSNSDEELKRQILSTADLNGESADEILSDDDSDDSSSSRKSKKSKKNQTLSGQREVFYTEDLTTFYKKHFNHELNTDEELEYYFQKALDSVSEFSDEYSKDVHLARCHYFYGLHLQEDFDLAAIRNLNLKDSSAEVDPNELAVEHYDKGIEYASAACKIKNGSDALSIWAQCISQNCTVKNVLYILMNGLKVRSYSKKAVKADYSNGTAHLYASAQDAYAPKPFNKAKKARKEILSYLNDPSIRREEYDTFDMCYAVGYTYYLKKKYSQATEWFNKCLEIYPNNVSANNMLKEIAALKK